MYEKQIEEAIKKAKAEKNTMDSYTVLGEEFAKVLKGKSKEESIELATEWHENSDFVEYLNELRVKLFAQHGKEGLGGCEGCGGCT